MTRYLLLLAGAGAIAWAMARWRLAVQAALVLLVVEGAIRKWLLPGSQDLVYFAKDALLLGCYLGFLTSPARHKVASLVPPAMIFCLVASAALGALQIFNPNLPNVLVGLLGFKAYFLYMPLLWVVPAAFTTDLDLARFLKRYVLLAIPVCLLAIAQFRSPADSALNVYARGNAPGTVSTFGISTQVRVTGTFSYISGYSSYLLAMAILVLAVLAATRWRQRGNWLVYGALGLTLLGMLMTGSRGPVFMLVLLLPLYGWLSLARENDRATAVGRSLLGLGLVAMLLNYVGSDAIGAFYGRAAGSSDLGSRMIGPILGPINTLEPAGLTGVGIGATHQTAAAVTKSLPPYSWLRGILLEDEPSRIMLELGLVGFLLIYFVRVYLVIFALQQVFLLRTTFHRAVATSCVLFFLAHLPGGIVFNVTAGVFYWFFAGLLMTVLRLDAMVAPARAAVFPRPAGGPPAGRSPAERPLVPGRPRPAPQPVRPAPAARRMAGGP